MKIVFFDEQSAQIATNFGTHLNTATIGEDNLIEYAKEPINQLSTKSGYISASTTGGINGSVLVDVDAEDPFGLKNLQERVVAVDSTPNGGTPTNKVSSNPWDTDTTVNADGTTGTGYKPNYVADVVGVKETVDKEIDTTPTDGNSGGGGTYGGGSGGSGGGSTSGSGTTNSETTTPETKTDFLPAIIGGAVLLIVIFFASGKKGGASV